MTKPPQKINNVKNKMTNITRVPKENNKIMALIIQTNTK